MKIKVNDTVLVTTGKYKGKTGKVLRVYRKINKITVEKVNLRTRHIRKTQAKPGERIRYEAPFHASNVMVICPHCNKAIRTGFKREASGKKYRVCKKCHQIIDAKIINKKTRK